MRLIVLFSGQGQQTLAHRDTVLADGDAEFLRAVEAALAPCGVTLPTLEASRLQDNRVAQVLIFALQWVRWQALRAHGHIPVLLAGYSAGETAAHTAAGLWTPQTGLALAAQRARLMSAAGAALGEPAGLMAVSGCAPASLTAALEGLQAHVAIRIGPLQAIVGGTARALEQLAARLEKQGGLQITRLAVEVPAHTPLLQPVWAPWHAALRETVGGDPQLALLSGTRGAVMRTRASALEALAEQVCTPLAWDACLDLIAEYRAEAILELGPGTALAHMVAQRCGRCPVRAVDDFRSFTAVAEWIAQNAP